MDDKVIIDCIGPSVLTITISGAAHSVPIATDVIRISDLGGATEHNLESLPLISDAAVLGGRLNICDGDGKMVYCWRSSVMLQSMPPLSLQGRADRSSYSSSGPVSWTEMIARDSIRTPVSSVQAGKRRSTSMGTWDMSSKSTATSEMTHTPSGNSSNEMTNSRDSTSDDTLEEPSKEPEGPANEELLVKFGRLLLEFRGTRNFEELQSKSACSQCGKYPEKPTVTSCLHIYCNACLESSRYEAAGKDSGEAHCAACNGVITESQSCQRLEELGIDDFLRLMGNSDQEVGQHYLDLDAKEPKRKSSAITESQKGFLVHAINKLMKLSCSEFFRQPVPADPVRYPTYIGITRPVDLKIMRDKLRANLYPSIEVLKADLDRMEQNSAVWNGAAHQHTRDAQKLKVAFEGYMTEYAEQDEEDFAPRKKAKNAREPQTASAQTATRVGPSYPPRAAKIAMQGHKYPRDHW